MSREKELATILRLIEQLKQLQSSGASEEEIEKLQDDIGDLQMNLTVGDLLE